MIGFVVVSHSLALAEAAVALACEMVADDRRPPIAVAAGLDDGAFGTDAAAVAEAIDSVGSADGVVVMVDLGSAVLSAEMALEFVDADVAERVRLSPAPLVEGLVAGVVTAATGASLEAVLKEAASGLVPKQTHLQTPAGEGDAASGPAGSGEGPEAGDTLVVDLLVDTPTGLHARPAARLVELVLASEADAALTNLRNGNGPVDPGSMVSLLTLDARQGDRVRLEASGPGAAELVAAVEKLAAEHWGD